VPLTGTGTDLTATYTVTIVKGAPNEAGAEAFVKYLLGPQGLAKLKQNGVHLVGPTVTGNGVPSSLEAVVKK
jgi:molybdate/tungstate transport system substrate-binding protein